MGKIRNRVAVAIVLVLLVGVSLKAGTYVFEKIKTNSEEIKDTDEDKKLHVENFTKAKDKTVNASDLVGVWYLNYTPEENTNWTWDINVLEINEDGTFLFYNKIQDKDFLNLRRKECKSYTFDEKNSLLNLKFDNVEWYLKVEKLYEDFYSMREEEYDSTAGYYASKDYEMLKKAFASYKDSIEYYEDHTDENGFYVVDGTLIKYMGDEKVINIPDNVKEIMPGAFSVADGYDKHFEKVIVPGSIKELKDSTFEFSSIETIVLEEGVEKIGNRCFGDTYLTSIYFPKTVKIIGAQIMDTEEALDGTKIYVYEGSEADKYFQRYEPYGDSEVVYR